MLEIFDQNPQSRVFHVDRECYIVYLGSHWEDYKPFLRLGTSTNLPPELPPIISTIVVPDVLTGNPLDEPTCLAGDATPDTHYVGDVQTVEHMKEFVDQESIPVEAIEEVDHEDEDTKHVFVYYYKDGNLKIKFHKNEVFDLRRREKQDAHFVSRAQESKNEYGRSPFKTPGSEYQPHGFVVVEGSPYLVARGELAALRLTNDYFFELSAAGLDADRISTVQAEDADTALIRFFKRSRTRNRPVRISTPRRERVEEAAGLFPENSLPALKAKVSDGHGGAFEFHRFTVSQAPGRFEAALEELGGSILVGSAAKKRPEAPVVVDPTAGSLSLAAGAATHPLLEGVVYQVSPGTLTRTAIEEAFLPQKNYPYRDLLSQNENNLVGQLQYLFNELFAGRDVGKVLRTIRGMDVVKGIGKSGSGMHPVLQVLLHNYGQYVGFIQNHEPELARSLEGLASLLGRHLLTRSDVPTMLPLVAEIHHADDRSYLFYRFTSRITSDRYAHAQRVVEKIHALPAVDFEAERTRLSDLIAGLATPEQMDEARMRRIAESRRQQEQRKAAEQAKQDEEQAQADSGSQAAAESRGERPGRKAAAAPADRTAAGTQSAGRRAQGTGGRARAGRGGRWVLPVAAVVVVVLALLALLFTGTIPNPWFGDETTVVEGEPGQNGDGVADDGDGAARGDEDETVSGSDAGDDGDGDAGVTGSDGTVSSDDDGTSGDGQTSAGDASADDGDAPPTDEEVITTDEGTPLPEGWPPDSLPALEALEDTPGVTITQTRVVGPGGIEITLSDIISLVNQIAADNGYATMDEVEPEKPDPDWIYPGNVFVLPNNTRYTVVDGDTLWEITVRYMVARLRQDYERYTELVSEYEADGTGQARRQEIVQTLRRVGAESHTENFTRLVEETLEQWGE